MLEAFSKHVWSVIRKACRFMLALERPQEKRLFVLFLERHCCFLCFDAPSRYEQQQMRQQQQPQRQLSQRAPTSEPSADIAIFPRGPSDAEQRAAAAEKQRQYAAALQAQQQSHPG